MQPATKRVALLEAAKPLGLVSGVAAVVESARASAAWLVTGLPISGRGEVTAADVAGVLEAMGDDIGNYLHPSLLAAIDLVIRVEQGYPDGKVVLERAA